MDFFNDIEKYRTNTALILETDEHISYETAINESELLRKKIYPKTLLFNFSENNYESVVGYLACLRNNTTQSLINPNVNSELITSIINAFNPHYIWTAKHNFYPGYEETYAFADYKLLMNLHPKVCDIHKEIALLLTTSGTTGSKKFVRQTFENIIANATAIGEALDISEKDRPITTLPFSYTYGLSVLNSHLLQGATIILSSKSIIDKLFWQQLQKHQATTFSGVPFTYEMLARLKFDRLNLGSITKITQAGGKLPDTLCKEITESCRKKGIRFFVMYGQTEATARISCFECSRFPEKIGSIGKVIPGGILSLIDEQGNRITKNNHDGELIYQGKNVTPGYASSIYDITNKDDNCGTLHTGDIGKKDKDGFFYITGRKKRFLKIVGNRVNLDEIEMVFHQKDIIVACTGKDDLINIWCIDSKQIPKIEKILTKKMRFHKKNFKIFKINSIPRNISGKIQYNNLIEIQ